MQRRSQILIALIPLFFAIQQASEGVLWLTLNGTFPSEIAKLWSMRIFLFFASIFWPFWIAFSLLIDETVPWRKSLLAFFAFAGFAMGFFNLYFGILKGYSVDVTDYRIHYMGGLPDERWIYVAIVVLPTFISSFKNAWMMGVLIFFTSVIATIFYDFAFISVWCFFAAIISMFLYKLFYDAAKIKQPDLK